MLQNMITSLAYVYRFAGVVLSDMVLFLSNKSFGTFRRIAIVNPTVALKSSAR